MQNNVSTNPAANPNLTAYAIRESIFAGVVAFERHAAVLLGVFRHR